MPKPSEKRMAHFRELVAYDQAHLGFGTSLAGMDEVGRGPLFGPVVTACVIMPADPLFPWIDDSKKLSPKRREELYDQILEAAVYVGVGRAAEKASATLCLVDAVRGLYLPFPVMPIIHGDATSYNVAAASIVAKVTRDRQMKAYAESYPQYGFERNMGYGTAEHISALRAFGATPEHRRSFIGNFVGEETVG